MALRRSGHHQQERTVEGRPGRRCRNGETPLGAARLANLVANSDGPSLSRYVQRHATNPSVYQLRGADPHMWAIPRLAGAAKAALVEIQIDEYGGGRAERMHTELFASTAHTPRQLPICRGAVWRDCAGDVHGVHARTLVCPAP
jgi:Iron-containing redox enzyme